MIMRELAAARLFTPEQEAAADDLVPGWRDMEPVEFQQRSYDAAVRLRAGLALERELRQEGEA